MITTIKDRLRPYLPRNIRHTLREQKERQFAQTHIVSSSPAVVALTWGANSAALHEPMKDRSLTLLYVFFWAVPSEGLGELAQSARQMLRKYPKHRIVMLCNEEFMVDRLRAEGVEAIFCNHNCLINEANFNVDETAVKKYDAIYNATMASYKRHELAAKIQSIALITYRWAGTYRPEYEPKIREYLSHAAWVVDAHKDTEKATPAQVAAFYNQSRVGLCLSASEGAMFASIEYLLCGLPIVTTRNSGGRDAFFDPDYTEWVEDDPAAVAQGVANVIARAPAAAEIRRRTLAKMEEHRQRLRDAVKDEVPNLKVPWQPGKTIGPLTRRNLRELGLMLRKA